MGRHFKPTIADVPADQDQYVSHLAYASKASWGYDSTFMESCRAELTYCSSYVRTHTVRAVWVDGQIMGFYALARIDDQTAELEALFVHPDAMGRGHGAALMQDALAKATERAEVLVVVSDPYAEAFYLRMGGMRVGKAPSGSIAGRALPLIHFRLKERS